MKINTIALWNSEGDLRRIDLHDGLNVITGASQTGKSTLIDVLEFCLGSTEFRVPAGPIAESVRYYGILVEAHGTRAFLGRPALPAGQQSSNQAQLEIGLADLPEFGQLRPTTTTEALRGWIAAAIGIEDNLFTPPEHATRRPLAAGVSHALIHCFQRQDEIASRQILFHRQAEDFVPQAIRDTLPYFLGVTGPDEIEKAGRLRELQRQLREISRRRAQTAEVLTAGLADAHALLAQAADAGLIEAASSAPPASVPDAVELLTAVRDAPTPPAPLQPAGEEFDRLQQERTDLATRLRDLREQRALATAIASDGDAASDEGVEQVVRLQSIGLVKSPEEPASCPICEQTIKTERPGVLELQGALTDLETQISAVARDRPSLVEKRNELRDAEVEVRTMLEANRAALDTLASSADAVAQHQQRLDLGTWVRGRIDYYLEQSAAASDDVLQELANAERDLRERVAELEAELDPARVREAATSSLVSIGRQRMTPMAERLGLEHADSGVRIDLARLTVVADTPAGPVYMDTGIGSAKNWVGYHLATTLSLQAHFVTEDRPVPGFLVLDQPTQAFFPADLPEEDATDEDRRDALAQFTLMNDVVQALGNRLQVLVLEHADFDEDFFHAAVVERWREGRALIPQGWY